MEAVTVKSGSWALLGEPTSLIRRIVFIDEQQVPQEEEWDGLDTECLHFLATLNGEPVGTARLLPDGHIGRVAVLSSARGTGIGYQLMEAAIKAAREAGHLMQRLAPSYMPSLSMNAWGLLPTATCLWMQAFPIVR